MRIVSPQRTPLKKPVTADVEWTRADAPCFGELYSGREPACQKLCDARPQCWAEFKRTYSTKPPGAAEEPSDG